MTIIAGFSSSRQGRAPLNLAAQISRCTGDKIIATAIVERPWPPKADPIEHEYLSYVTSQASRSLERVVSQLPTDLDISVVVHQSTSIPTGLTELAAEHKADVVVVGSSSSGLLGGVGLGSDRPARAYRGSARGDRPARLPDESRSCEPVNRGIRRPRRRGRPHRDMC